MRSPDRQRVVSAIAVDGLLDTDHQARIVWDFCRELDLSTLYNRIRSREGGPGRAALDPRLGVALWLYATLEGVGSARALDTLCIHHNAFRWLCGGVSVNYHTLADFRTDHPEFLDRLLTHSVAVLREQDLVDLNRVALDGVRVRANAGAASFHRKATLEECLAEAEGQVARLKQEMDEDPSAPSRRHTAARQRAARERVERLQQALKRLPELEAKKAPAERDTARCSTTDPQATVMKMADGGFRPAYNVELGAACGSLAIVAVEVTTSGSDGGQITPLVDQIHDRHEVFPGEVLADGGFVNLSDIERAEDGSRGCTVYAPVPEPKDPTRDRHQPLPTDRPVIGKWRTRMGTEAGQEVYRQRAATIECVNAQARNRGLLRLLVRGVEKVKTVVLWFAVAHNVACGARLRAELVGLA
ncbi:MAG TPA: IS1182 family transposase [Pseudolysinimonas sp.]